MLNSVRMDKRIAYMNGIPYGVNALSLYDIVKLGDKGEKIDYAIVSGEGIHKIVNNRYLYKDIYKGDFELRADNIVGAVYQDSDCVYVFRPDGTVQNVITTISSGEKISINGINGIKNVYNVVPKSYCILRDNDNKLMLWSSRIPFGSTGNYKGSYIKLHAYDTLSIKPGEEDVVFLTDETLYRGKPLKGFNPIPLPSGITPDDVKDIQVVANNNVFLLDNDGRVYSMGKNGYNQRGTTKKLKVSEWNQIEYPEKIKQIAVGNVPGIFALSENGNLYYHGYNERGYYLITGRKSNISKPTKILDNVDSLWMVRVFGGKLRDSREASNMLLFFDNEGTLKRLMDGAKREEDRWLIKPQPIMLPFKIYDRLIPDLIMNRKMLLAYVGYKCGRW